MRDFNFRWAEYDLFSLSGFANLSTKITTQREFTLSLPFFAERKQSVIPLSES